MTAEGEKPGVLCTIGYERASLAGFVAALKAANVGTLVDVRSHPWSQRPEFRQDALRRHLLAAGIGYVHIRALGNPDEGRAAAKAGDAETYRAHMSARIAAEDGQKGLARVVDLARKGPVALMCYERDPARCHRSMVADALAELDAPRHLFAE